MMTAPHRVDDSADRVTVITVTYGDRWDVGLRATIESVLAETAADLIVVGNGATQRVNALLEKSAARADGRIELVTFERNRGSAPAFAAALSSAYQRGTPVLILDDDNPLPAGALARLDSVARALRAPGGRLSAVACFRAVNPVHVQLRSGIAPREVFAELRPGAFLSTDVFRSRRGRSEASVRRVQTDLGAAEVVPLPNAMWGGLYLPRETVAHGVLPPSEFVLYADDNAFSARLRAAGVDIWLCFDVEIHDTIDWRASAEPARGLVRIPRVLRTAEADLWRVRYQTRNAAFLSAQQARPSRAARARLAVNVVVRLGLLFLAAAAALRLPVFIAVLRASIDGLRGRLGPSYALPGGDTPTAS